MTLYDREIVCPYCGSEQLIERIPLVNFPGDGQIFRCKSCNEHYRVGMVIEPFVSQLRRGK